MNILFTSVGRRSYLVKYFKKALGNKGKIYVANSTALSPAFQVADDSIVTPSIYNQDYIPFLLDYCSKMHITAIISLFDIDLPVLAKHKEEFARNGINVLVSDYEFIQICNDKWETFRFLRDNGFPAPQTYLELKESLRAIDQNKLRYPVIVKPRWGMGSIGVYQADNADELKVFYEKTKSTIMKSYLKYESELKIEESVIIQEKIEGQEYGLDVFNDLEGKYKNTCVKKKIAMRSGETDCALTVDKPDLKQLGERIAGLSHHIGNLDIDVFETDTGYHVLDMNARFGGGYPFSHIAGVDMPQAIVNWLGGKEVPGDLLTPQIGVLGQKDIEIVSLPESALE